MNELPLDIFRIIQQYLNNHDYRQLLNTNLAIFQYVKYETVYYNIRINLMRVILVGERCGVIDYLSQLYESVKDKNQQISLHIDVLLEECRNFMSGIHKLVYSCWQDIFFFSGENPDISVFDNICHLHLISMNNIDRLSGISRVKILHVSNCNSLISIDFIPELKRLVIESLPELLRIADYRNIPELYIRDCLKLNLHGLGNHKRFSFVGRNRTIPKIELSVFQNTQYLEISKDYYQSLKGLDEFRSSFLHLIFLDISFYNETFNISFFPNLRSLHLRAARIISEVLFPSTVEIAEFERCSFDDLFVLSTVKELGFYRCTGRGFNNINSLSNAYKLVLCEIKNLRNVSSLDRVYDLSLFSCDKVKDVSKLGRVHRLSVVYGELTTLAGLGQGNSNISLSSLSSLIDFSPLRFIYKVTLNNCYGLIDGRDLSDVKILKISRCSKFKHTSNLGKVEYLSLIGCDELERLVGLENVPHIHLEDCQKLEDIDCLGKQKSLIIKACFKLERLIEKDVSGKYDRLLEGIDFLRMDDYTASCDSSIFKPLSRCSNKLLNNFDN